MSDVVVYTATTLAKWMGWTSAVVTATTNTIPLLRDLCDKLPYYAERVQDWFEAIKDFFGLSDINEIVDRYAALCIEYNSAKKTLTAAGREMNLDPSNSVLVYHFNNAKAVYDDVTRDKNDAHKRLRRHRNYPRHAARIASID